MVDLGNTESEAGINPAKDLRTYATSLTDSFVFKVLPHFFFFFFFQCTEEWNLQSQLNLGRNEGNILHTLTSCIKKNIVHQ